MVQVCEISVYHNMRYCTDLLISDSPGPSAATPSRGLQRREAIKRGREFLFAKGYTRAELSTIELVLLESDTFTEFEQALDDEELETSSAQALAIWNAYKGW